MKLQPGRYKINFIDFMVFFFIFSAIFSMVTFAQDSTATGITPNVDINELLGYIAPLLVIGVTQLVRKFSPQISGWVITLVIVPATAAILAYIATLFIGGSMSWLETFLLGLLSVFLVELRKQLKQGNDNSPAFNDRKTGKR